MPSRLLCLLACFFSLACADDLDHIAFEGTITDAAGSAIAGAVVRAHHTASATERTITTNKDGRFRLLELAPGAYELSVAASGFQTVRVTGLTAVAGTTIRRDFALAPAALAEQVTIDAEADQTAIDTTRTVIGGTINRAEVARLPIESRNPFDLVYLLPHTAPPAYDDRNLAEGGRQEYFRRPPEETGIFALGGGAPFSNNLTIEGFDNNDDRGARERFTPSLNTVEEVQVITNQFAAEYGRASGGRVNLRLRGGANNFHGQGFYFFRDESLNANSFTRNANPERGYRIPYQDQNPGASLGGPILKDRVFFFAGYEYDSIYDRAEIAALVPVASNPNFALPKPNGAELGFQAKDNKGKTVIINSGLAVGLYDESLTTPRRAHSAQTRIDFKLGAGHDAFALVTLARNRDERGFPGGRRTLDTIRSTGRNSQSIALSDNLVLSPRLINNLRFQFSRLAPADAPPSLSPVVIIDLDDPRDVIGDTSANPFTRHGTLLAGSTTSSGSDRREDRYQFQMTTTYLRGGHTWRFGFDSQSINSRFVDLADSTGTFTFARLGDFVTNRPTRYEHRFNTESLLGNTYTGFFAQDDWRARPGLTVSAGLRYDNETILDDRNNFGPRLSFAWAPRNSSKTVVRAGYGIFYNRALLRTLDDFVLTSGAVRVDTNTDLATPLLAELKFPAPLAANDPRVTKYGVREAGFLRRLEPGFRISESYQASTGFEREISKGFKVEINYLFNRGLHLWRESNANAPRLPAGFADFAAYLTSRDFDNALNPGDGRAPAHHREQRRHRPIQSQRDTDANAPREWQNCRCLRPQQSFDQQRDERH